MPSPQKLNMRKMFNAFIKTDGGRTKHLYFADDLGIVLDAVNILSPFILNGQGPFLIEDYRLVICKKGYIHTVVNLQEFTIEEGMMAVIVPGSIVEPISLSDDFTVTGIGVSEERMRMAYNGHMPDILCNRQRPVILATTEEESCILEQVFGLMWNLANKKSIHLETLDSMICIIAHVYDDIFKSHNSDVGTNVCSPSRQHEIFQNFISLVNEHCRRERQLDFYADRLYITKRYLGSIIQEVSGITAKDWIDRAVVTAAKVMLRHTTKSISQISDELHFPNDSFFCKYFKRLTDKTPLAWRNDSFAPQKEISDGHDSNTMPY